MTLIVLIGGNFAVAKNQILSASLGVPCASESQNEFLTADRTDSTDKSELDRQVAKNAKVFETSLEPVLRESTSLHSFSISASLRDLCALAVNSSSTRTTTGPVATIIPSQSQSFTVNDRLTTDTYDANGNTTESRSVGVSPTSSSDVYSFDNRLIRRTNASGQVIDLTYNPDGHRLTKFITQNGLTQRLVHYLTDANNPTGYAQVIEEKDPLAASGQELKKVNLYGHDLISTEERGTGAPPVSSIFYTYDGLGSVLESSNLSSTIPDPQSDYLYTGEQFDFDLGMYFLRARYLNTNTGRFHTQDTYEGRSGEPLTLHKYLYVNGNPAGFTDPSGNMTLGEMSFVQGQLSNENNQDAQRTNAQKNAFTKTPFTKVRFGVASGLGSPGIAGRLFGHAFIFAESLRNPGSGLYLDANPDLADRNTARRFARNMRMPISGIIGIEPRTLKSLSDPPLNGRLILPGIELSIIQSIAWITMVKGISADITYKFYSLPGGETVSCYTWAIESYAKALLVKTIIR
jgi:RHS repeat-associated protein